MNLEGTVLKPNSNVGSGGVHRFVLPGGKITITRITTFCPDEIGPGPTHVYLIDSDALILLDTGMPTNLAKAFFYHWRSQAMPPEVEELLPGHAEQELLEGVNLAGYAVSDIDLIVFSHGHLDHFLMAGSILSRTKAGVSAHIEDTPGICNPWGMLNMWISGRRKMIPTGMPLVWSPDQSGNTDALLGLDPESMGLSVKVDQPILRDGPINIAGSPVRGIEVKHIPGHSPGSIGLAAGDRAGKVFMCGDVLLNPITPHPDDLLVYLRTLEQLGEREDIGLTLPAHGHWIRDLKARVAFLKDHHRNRLKLTYDACHDPRSVWDIASMGGYFDTYVDPKLFNYLAGTEALVHMELLNMVGGLRRTHIKNQVHYFENSREPFDQVYGRIMELVQENGARPIMRY